MSQIERASKRARKMALAGARIVVAIALCIAVTVLEGVAQEVRYLYDAKGQVVGVIDVDGSAATYQFAVTNAT